MMKPGAEALQAELRATQAALDATPRALSDVRAVTEQSKAQRLRIARLSAKAKTGVPGPLPDLVHLRKRFRQQVAPVFSRLHSRAFRLEMRLFWRRTRWPLAAFCLVLLLGFVLIWTVRNLGWLEQQAWLLLGNAIGLAPSPNQPVPAGPGSAPPAALPGGPQGAGGSPAP